MASMEPWFGNHGNLSALVARFGYNLLQWSRGSVTTETNLRLAPETCRTSSFNGAVVR